ncbi:MAG: phosphodiesterase [Hyphomonadaceae bacterium]
MSAHFLLAQISDCHIGGPAQGGRTPEQRLARALEALSPFRPHAILATGDLANDEKPEEYAVLARLLAPASAPVFLIPGNHDAPAALRAAFPTHAYLPAAGPLSYVIDDFPVRIVAIDQTTPGAVHGDFTEAHAAWLEAALARAPGTPTLVALHHPPFPSHDRLFDGIGLLGAERFIAIIARHRQVRRVLCGHHHRLVYGMAAHAPVVCAPATAWSYGLALRPEQRLAAKADAPCGAMLHVWSAAGGFASHFLSI